MECSPCEPSVCGFAAAWIHGAAARGTCLGKNNLKIIEKRIDYDLIMSHNLLYRLKGIECQTLLN